MPTSAGTGHRPRHTIRAIATDLDGTLLNSRKELSPRAVRALERMQTAGKKIIVATARPPRSVNAMLPGELLDICVFFYYNGAMVVDENGTLLHGATIPQELSSRLSVLSWSGTRMLRSVWRFAMSSTETARRRPNGSAAERSGLCRKGEASKN